MIKYTRFQSSSPGTGFIFLYPADWTLRETVEDGFTQILIFESEGMPGTYRLSLSVRVTAGEKQSLEEVATDFFSHYHSAFDCQQLGRASGMLSENPAVEIEIAYSTLLSLEQVDSPEILVRERRIFFYRSGRLYELGYAAPEDKYEGWLEAFRVLAQTFWFLEKGQGAVFRPFVARVTVDAADNLDTTERGE